MPKPVLSQSVIPDSTLGTVMNVNASEVTITGGRTSGTNLFHSFEHFSPGNQSVVFDLTVDPAQAAAERIFSRVTGNAASHINGNLQTLGGNSPDLFLINPNGIQFGANAQLQIDGDFLGTTATDLLFENNVTFSATPAASPLLSMSAPIGLNFGGVPGSITVQGTGNPHARFIFTPTIRSPITDGLTVSPGQNLTLLGGDIYLNGGVLAAESGTVALGSIGPNGRVELANGGSSVSYATVSEFRDITLDNSALIDVSGGQSGSVQLHGGNIFVQNDAEILSQNFGSGISGAIQIEATERLSLNQNGNHGFQARILSEALPTATQPSADIRINAPQVLIVDDTEVVTASYGGVDAGDVVVTASESLVVGGSQLFTNSILGSATAGSGLTGNIVVNAPTIRVFDGGIIGNSSIGQGNTGDVLVNAQSILVDGVSSSGISAITSTAFATGGTGDVTINTATLTAQNGGSVTSSGVAQGDGGNITINATDAVVVDGGTGGFNSQLRSSINVPSPFFQQILGLSSVPSGNAGNLTINTPSLRVTKGGALSVRNEGIGNAGDLVVAADRLAITEGGGIFSSTRSGQGGNLQLMLGELAFLRNQGIVSSEALGPGNGGNIFIQAPVIVALGNSDIIADAVTGNGGNVSITAQGILGLTFRDQLTPDNDITASSQFGVNGTVVLNNFGVNPDAGLLELPTGIADYSNQIGRGCGVEGDNEFVVTGQGSVSVAPENMLQPDTVWLDSRNVTPLPRDVRSSGLSALPTVEPVVKSVTEAVTWQINAAGNIALMAGPAGGEPLVYAGCPGSHHKARSVPTNLEF
ncbi:two-partner secretion domain-containing protein [Leptothoe kymatousa]|uniref:Filamentous hemagglutinin N-terminal domain-containing protein n=1 Tax=Leptothoe kymatousa TAU-MAC 1615 TaxID=2364775 RepID=A0ABS5Y1F2_9CYAN|nr:filamentous hemagglutinin N-terminal domain-containing protein [Leptothoe kymatousa]MBT9311643.1 filamentous hemagglutinin N-terminal domain-containing protein [Leptothoe kymatousa TAU-MAC 1615]